MPRKKIEPILTLGKDIDKLTVQKSMPLFSLWQSSLTLQEFKILDVYLSRINSHNPEKRTVMFKRGELENVLGIKQLRQEDLEKRLKNLMNPLKIDDITAKNGKFAIVSLFEKTEAFQDDKGLWTIEMTATPTAMKYFFNIENLGYLRYKLRCIMALKSRYTYIMFLYIEENRFRKKWKVEIDELKSILCCEEYSNFSIFNRDVLKRVHNELNEKTECKYKYSTIKNGRSVVGIEFEVNTLPKISDIDPDQITIEQYRKSLETIEDDGDSDPWDFVYLPLEPMNLTKVQKDEIRSILVTVPREKFPKVNDPSFGEDLYFKMHHYIDQQYHILLRRDAEKTINRKYSYLIKMLRQDANLEEN